MMKLRSALVSESVACVTWKVSRVSEKPVSRVPAPIQKTSPIPAGRSSFNQKLTWPNIASVRSRLNAQKRT